MSRGRNQGDGGRPKPQKGYITAHIYRHILGGCATIRVKFTRPRVRNFGNG